MVGTEDPRVLPGPQRLRRAAVPIAGAGLVAAYLLGRWAPFLDTGAHLAIRWWGAIVLYAVAAGSCLARAALVERARAAWALIGGGVLAYGGGSLLAIVSGADALHPPAASHVLWLSFYAAAYAALVVLLRARIRPFVPSFCLDGLIGGLAVGAVCASIVPPDLSGHSTGEALAGFAYPSADLVLLTLVLWASAMSGWRGGMWLWLWGALALAAVGDVLLDLQVVGGTYSELSWVSACFPAAMMAIGVAAWRPASRPRPLRSDALSVLALPGISVVAVLAVLVLDGPLAPDDLARTLALCALAIAFGRAVLTYRELRTLQETRRFQRGFEEATIGMALVGPDLRWLRVNGALAALAGRPAPDLVGRSMLDVLHP